MSSNFMFEDILFLPGFFFFFSDHVRNSFLRTGKDPRGATLAQRWAPENNASLFLRQPLFDLYDLVTLKNHFFELLTIAKKTWLQTF